MAAARLRVSLGRGVYVVAELRNIQIKAQLWHLVGSTRRLKFSLTAVILTFPLRPRSPFASELLLRASRPVDYNHGSTATQPRLPLSVGTNVILATKCH